MTNLLATQPSALLSDETIVAALERTSLWFHFTSGKPSTKVRQILNSSMASLPQMSTGQLQLLALTRAVLQGQILRGPFRLSESQPNHGCIMPILLLDEATSSLDPATESAMRSVINEEFIKRGHTVIAITHRLGGVIKDMRAGEHTIAMLSNGNIERIEPTEQVLSSLVSL